MLARDAVLSDINNIVGLWVELINEVKLHNCLTNDIEKDRFFVYIAKRILNNDFVKIIEDSERAVGFITAWMNDKTAFVDNIYLKKEFRQPELFFKFIKYAENKAKQDGAEYIGIETVYEGRFSQICHKLGFMPERVKVKKCLG